MTDKIEHDINSDLMEMLSAIFIINRRTYDVLARLLANLDDEEAETLMRIHSEGGFITPPPSYRVGDNEEDGDEV